VADILRARMLAMPVTEPVLGPVKPDPWEDGINLDTLRNDPAFKPACGCLPDSGDDLCS